MPFDKLAPTEDVRKWYATFVKDPIPPRLRIYSPRERGHLAEAVSAWNSRGFIEPTRAFVLCNPTFAEKKDGTIRTCVDYTPINQATADFVWPMPRIQDVRFRVLGATRFSRLDLTNAFMENIEVPEEHRGATAFNTPWGAWQFRRLPFGLKTAPAFFQRFMDFLLRAHNAHALWYIDDILIFSNARSHEACTRAVIKTLRMANIQISWKKSELNKDQILFVGMVFSGQGLTASPLIRTIADRDVPTTIKDKQSFLGFANYFRDFVPGFATLAAPLYPDQHNNSRSPDYIRDFTTLVTQCMSHVSLNHYEDDKDGTLFTDASKYATGAVLIQQGRVCAIRSKTLTPAQTRYSTTDREHLALLDGCESFRAFIQSNKCLTVSTDHMALLNRSDENLTPRQVRWKTRVVNTIGRVNFVKGLNNPADYLSRKGSWLGIGGPFGV